MKISIISLTALLAASACSHDERSAAGKQGTPTVQVELLRDSAASAASAATKKQKESPGVESSVAGAPSDSDYRNDSLAVFFKKQYEVEYFKAGKDTLELVLGSDIPYYPFGHCQNVGCVKSRLPNFVFRAERDTTNEPVELQRGAFKNSFIKLMYDPEKKHMQVVSGKINDSEVVLFNDIRTGMAEEIFLALFIKNSSFTKGKRPGVIRLTSVVNGISHFYTFDKNILKSVIFQTDYALNKE